MIDVTKENLQPVRSLLTTMLKRNVHPGTIWRWTKKGIQNGARLETIRIGQRLFSTPEAVQRFAAACDCNSIEMPAAEVPTTIIPARAKVGATDAELKACGLL